ncbi:hypothetical protein [Streptomyces sp. CH-036]|uniref:hypothetical protein n=1 Tax=Streptomyces sp. CH-036 TaxID=3406733 RepID=UPI003C730053
MVVDQGIQDRPEGGAEIDERRNRGIRGRGVRRLRPEQRVDTLGGEQSGGYGPARPRLRASDTVDGAGEAVDGSWAAAHLGAGRFDRYLLFGATAIQWPAWVAGTALGVVVSPDPDLLHRLGLDVLTPALFLALLCDEVRRERINRLPALLGAAIAAGLIVFLPAGPALVGAALAALVALLRTSARHRRADGTGEKAVAETMETAGPAVQPESGLRSAHSGEEVAP